MTFTVAVSAGRYDRSRKAVAGRIERAMRLGSDLILSTEVMRDQRDAFRGHQGWSVAFVGEYALLSRDVVFKRKTGPAKLAYLSVVHFMRGIMRTPADSGRIRYKHVDGWSFDVDVFHLPAHLDKGTRYSNEPEDHSRVRAHQQALERSGTRARRGVRRHPKRARLWTGDLNVNLFKAAWRDFVDGELHPLSPVWTGDRLPGLGDLGHPRNDRLVVGAWTHGLQVVGARILSADGGSDHRMMVLELRRLE